MPSSVAQSARTPFDGDDGNDGGQLRGRSNGVQCKTDSKGNVTVHLTPEFIDLFVPSRDLQGHTAPQRWQAEVPPYLNAEVRRFINDPSNEYGGDMGKFIRKAAITLLAIEYQRTRQPGASNFEVIQNIALSITQSQTRRQYLESLQHDADEAAQLIAIGNEEAAIDLIHDSLRNIRKLPKGSKWRQLMQDAIQRRFGHLLKQGKFASLLDRADEDED